MKLRQYLWLLRGWTQLTSMPPEQWGLAVALSMGGAALEKMMQIPVDTLMEPNSLATVVYLLEQTYATDESELQKDAFDKWELFSREKGQDMTRFLARVDLLLGEASKHGLYLNSVGLSRELLRKARLSADDKRWVLLPVQGDYNRYLEIRHYMKRLPAGGGRGHSGSAPRERYFEQDQPPPHSTGSLPTATRTPFATSWSQLM